ncbi:hypothetical protein DKX38_001158 [Salix brachista]|uniref:Uncharacterized protein n=1 Tax=Salix brachista TaxID=2182728 RepID=A0A5N5P2G8_9ROSI|nr:hypothetical protein DKX38_001158 [Salix brachista]
MVVAYWFVECAGQVRVASLLGEGSWVLGRFCVDSFLLSMVLRVKDCVGACWLALCKLLATDCSVWGGVGLVCLHAVMAVAYWFVECASLLGEGSWVLGRFCVDSFLLSTVLRVKDCVGVKFWEKAFGVWQEIFSSFGWASGLLAACVPGWEMSLESPFLSFLVPGGLVGSLGLGSVFLVPVFEPGQGCLSLGLGSGVMPPDPPTHFPPPFVHDVTLKLQPPVKTNPFKINNLGNVSLAPDGVGHSNQHHKHAPPENFWSAEETEEEESSSSDSNSCSSESSDLGQEDVFISPPPTTNDVSSPPSPRVPVEDSDVTEPLVLAAVKRNKNSKRDRSMAREVPVADTAARADSAALSSGLQPLSVVDDSVCRVDFASFSSDPMYAKVAAAAGEWETVKKKQCNRHVKQATTLGGGFDVVGLIAPHDPGVATRHKSSTLARNKGQDSEGGSRIVCLCLMAFAPDVQLLHVFPLSRLLVSGPKCPLRLLQLFSKVVVGLLVFPIMYF